MCVIQTEFIKKELMQPYKISIKQFDSICTSNHQKVVMNVSFIRIRVIQSLIIQTKVM